MLQSHFYHLYFFSFIFINEAVKYISFLRNINKSINEKKCGKYNSELGVINYSLGSFVRNKKIEGFRYFVLDINGKSFLFLSKKKYKMFRGEEMLNSKLK